MIYRYSIIHRLINRDNAQNTILYNIFQIDLSFLFANIYYC